MLIVDEKECPAEDVAPIEQTESNVRGESTEQFIDRLLESVSKNSVNDSINRLTSYHTRHTKSRLINEVAKWLLWKLQSFGYTDVYFNEYTDGGYALKNVICHKPSLMNKTVIICAHYDSIMEPHLGLSMTVITCRMKLLAMS